MFVMGSENLVEAETAEEVGENKKRDEYSILYLA
jgi:hypothetical protein